MRLIQLNTCTDSSEGNHGKAALLFRPVKAANLRSHTSWSKHCLLLYSDREKLSEVERATARRRVTKKVREMKTEKDIRKQEGERERYAYQR